MQGVTDPSERAFRRHYAEIYLYVRINAFLLLPDAEDAILAAARQLQPASG